MRNRALVVVLCVLLLEAVSFGGETVARISFDSSQDLRHTKEDHQRYFINRQGTITEAQLSRLAEELEDESFTDEAEQNALSPRETAFGVLFFTRILDFEAMKMRLPPDVSAERVDYVVKLILYSAARSLRPEIDDIESIPFEKLYRWFQEFGEKTAQGKVLRFEITWEVRQDLELEWQSLHRNSRTGRDLSHWKKTILRIHEIPVHYSDFVEKIKKQLQVRHLYMMRAQAWSLLFQKKYPDFSFYANRVEESELRALYEDLKPYLFVKSEGIFEPFENSKVQELVRFLTRGLKMNKLYRELLAELFRAHQVIFEPHAKAKGLDDDLVRKAIPIWVRTILPGINLEPFLNAEVVQKGAEESETFFEKIYFSFLTRKVFNLPP